MAGESIPEYRRMRYGTWQEPIPRWLGYCLFTVWMVIFAFVPLVLFSLFVLVSKDWFYCVGIPTWFWWWRDITYGALRLWYIAAWIFLAVVLLRPPKHRRWIQP